MVAQEYSLLDFFKILFSIYIQWIHTCIRLISVYYKNLS